MQDSVVDGWKCLLQLDADFVHDGSTCRCGCPRNAASDFGIVGIQGHCLTRFIVFSCDHELSVWDQNQKFGGGVSFARSGLGSVSRTHAGNLAQKQLRPSPAGQVWGNLQHASCMLWRRNGAGCMKIEACIGGSTCFAVHCFIMYSDGEG